MKKIEHTILRQTGSSINLPIFLESTVDEMGVMVSFDGGVEQVEQLCNVKRITADNISNFFKNHINYLNKK